MSDKLVGISDKESVSRLTTLLELYSISAEDTEKIHSYGDIVVPKLDEFVGLFYDWLRNQPEFEEFFPDEETINYVQKMSRDYWKEFFRHELNEDYLKKRYKIGETHAGNPGANSSRGTMQHVALKVKDKAELLAMRDRLRSKGVPVMGPMDHGMCESIYFAGPENLTLEISTNDGANAPLDLDGTRIDQEVVNLAGISAEELDRYRNPADYEAPAEPEPQPAYDASKPMFALPEEVLHAMLQAPDEAITEAVSDTVPPGK